MNILSAIDGFPRTARYRLEPKLAVYLQPTRWILNKRRLRKQFLSFCFDVFRHETGGAACYCYRLHIATSVSVARMTTVWVCTAEIGICGCGHGRKQSIGSKLINVTTRKRGEIERMRSG